MFMEWLLMNKEFLKIIYVLVVCFICAGIVLKTDRMFKLSDYQGFRYFRNAFFFYGLSFVVRFILGASFVVPQIGRENYLSLVEFFFEFFIMTAGFFLLYSLIWKRIEKEKSYNSLFNLRAAIFYSIALIFSLIDFLLQTSLLMYLSQILLFLIMAIICYKNFSSSKGRYKFLKYYFLIILLGLLAWIFNALIAYFLNWNKVIHSAIYILNFLFFVFFLYAIKKITEKKNG